MSDNANTKTLQNDEIDLRELWTTLVKRKMTILTVTAITTISAALYAYTAAPVYRGEVLVEVGEVINNNQPTINNNQPTTIFTLDNINNLQTITVRATGLNVEIPKNVTNILRISCDSTNKNEISLQLQKAVGFIMERHKQKATLYKNENAKIQMTRIIGGISITDQPIKPKKQLIVTVAFISGLILGIFLAFFREFISKGRKVAETPEMNKK